MTKHLDILRTLSDAIQAAVAGQTWLVTEPVFYPGTGRDLPVRKSMNKGREARGGGGSGEVPWRFPVPVCGPSAL